MTKFIPKPGQVDFTNIRYCPVVNCLVRYRGKILMVKRSAEMDLYPNYWDGVAGFLDDDQSVEDKVKEEILEELYIDADQIESIKRGNVLIHESKKYQKTWIVFPILVDVKTNKFELDYEAQDAKWLDPTDAKKLDLAPGVDRVLGEFF